MKGKASQKWLPESDLTNKYKLVYEQFYLKVCIGSYICAQSLTGSTLKFTLQFKVSSIYTERIQLHV